MKRACLLAVCLLSISAHAAVPPIQITADVQTPTALDITTYAGNTPVIIANIKTNGGAYLLLGSGWTPQLNYAKNDYASYIKTITGTVDAASGIATFTCATNTFPASGDWLGEVYLANGAQKMTCAQGIIRVKKSPSSGAIGSLNLVNRVNWDIISSIGTLPWSDFDTNYLGALITVLQGNTNALNSTATNHAAQITALQSSTNFIYTTLRSTTGALNTAVAALQANTQYLNTATANLNASTGALNSYLAIVLTNYANIASTQFLNTSVANLNLSTGALNGSVAIILTNYANIGSTQSLNSSLNIVLTNYANIGSTQSLNTAVAQLKLDTNALNAYITNIYAVTGSLNTAVTTLNTQTNLLSLRIGAVQTNIITASNALQNASGTYYTNNLNALGAVQTNLNTASNSLAAAVDAVSSAGLTRYFARTNSDSSVEVLASTTNITCTRSSATFTFTIPANTRLLSAKIRVDGTYSPAGAIYLVMGTNDMNNSGTTTMWNPVASCFREDTLASVTLTCLPYDLDTTEIEVTGLGSTAGVIYNCRFNW